MTATIDCKPMASESLIQTCIFGSIIALNIHSLVCLSIVNALHEQNLKAQSIIQIQKRRAALYTSTYSILFWFYIIVCGKNKYL